MKFSHSLKFNSVAEWRQHYINYGALKKLSYAIEKQEEEGRQREMFAQQSMDLRQRSMRQSVDLPRGAVEEDEARRRASLDASSSFTGSVQQPLLQRLSSGLGGSLRLSMLERSAEEGGKVSQADFQRSLDSELHKIVDFYITKEAELKKELAAAELDARAAEASSAGSSGFAEMQAERLPRPSFWRTAASDALKAKMHERLCSLYVQLVDLLNFIELNRTGFRKILKKHDKVTDVSLMTDYMPVVTSKLSSKREEDLGAMINEVIKLHAMVMHNSDTNASEVDLKRNLRDHVTYERDTIWRDMVALERRNITVKVPEGAPTGGFAKWWQIYHTPVMVAAALLLFFVILNIDIWPNDTPKRRCAAMLALLVTLWTSEALPLYVTSMLVPLLTVLLRILPDEAAPDGHPQQLPAPKAAEAVFKVMFSQVIMLLLGGFAIAGALSKHYIAKAMASNILSRVGTRPRDVILANMFVATFASMWISNVAAPVLCFSLIQPILRTLPSHHPVSKCLVMGIALASNVGGMTSPISSPQNIFAIELMARDGAAPNWLTWFVVSIPVSIASNLFIWAILLAVYRPGLAIREVRHMRRVQEPITKVQVYVVAVSSLTVALWCASSALEQYLGSQGIIAIFPLVMFFGLGVLDKDDFNNFLWHVVMLAQGGLVLGLAVKGSGLLADVAGAIRGVTAGMSLFGILFTFCALVLVCTTFISHTVGAMVILPIVRSVGQHLSPTPHPRLLVMGAALACSGAMGLPVSGFPNMNAVSLEDATGKTYVNTLDFLMVGLLGSLTTFCVIVTLGYALMMLMHY